MYNRLATYMQEFFETVRKNIGAITIIALFLLIISIKPAHASIIDIPIKSLIEDSLANFFYSLQTMASWLIFLAGALLNFSINLTMHIKDFVSSTESVYTVWKTIRDISGIFIIGTLLYTAIMMIIGSSKPLGGIIKNIVIAGVLINFSFFLTGVAIDASNIVSLQLYNAIAPQQSLNTGNVNDTNYLKNSIAKSKADGGLSTIFMQSLGITRLYNPDGSKSTAGVAADGKSFTGASAQIILIGLTSVIIMITAALSFFLASLAFIVRFVILIALLAFSPIWFASFIVPEIDKYAGKWRDTLKNQLVFMPVYLLLMYFALSILTSSSIFKNGYSSRLTPSGDFWSDLMVLAINAVLVITMLNLPLLGAISMGAIMPGWAKNVGADAIWKKVGGWAGGTVGRPIVGGFANKIGEGIDKSRFAGGIVAKLGNTIVGRDLRAATLGAATKAKFGGDRSYEDINKLNKEVNKKGKELSRSQRLYNLLRNNNAAPEEFDKLLKEMGAKERQAIEIDNLTKSQILRYLKKDDFEAIKKSEEISPEDQKKVEEARKELFEKAIKGDSNLGGPEEIKTILKDMFKNYSAEDIAKLDDELLEKESLIGHLSNDHLKKIADGDKTSAETKAQIARTILNWKKSDTDKQHRAYGWIKKNKKEWLPGESDEQSATQDTNTIILPEFERKPPKSSTKF